MSSDEREEMDHYDDPDDPLVYLRDAIGHAEGREQGILNQAHNQILKVRKGQTTNWICPTCGDLCRAEEKPNSCPWCGHDGRELVHKAIKDV